MLFNAEEVRRAVSLLKREGEVFEVRILEGKTKALSYSRYTYAGFFDNSDSLIHALNDFTHWANCYISLQEVHPDLLHRSYNKLKESRGEHTSISTSKK